MSISVEYENEFDRVVENYEKTDFYSKRLCPDQYVGLIKDLEVNYYSRSSKNNIFDYSQGTISLGLYDNILLLILESPHKNEFDKNGEPIGPAMGTTGRNIQSYIGKIFGKKFNNYHLILMNAIPFQCSLGTQPPGSIRDAVFADAWSNTEIGESFFKEKRLKALLGKLAKKDVFIVNACTKDNDDKNGKGRKSKVTESVKKVIKECQSKKPTIELWEAPHPSSLWWFNEKYWKKIQ